MGSGRVNPNLEKKLKIQNKLGSNSAPLRSRKSWPHFAKEVKGIGGHEYANPSKPSFTKPMLKSGPSKLKLNYLKAAL